MIRNVTMMCQWRNSQSIRAIWFVIAKMWTNLIRSRRHIQRYEFCHFFLFGSSHDEIGYDVICSMQMKSDETSMEMSQCDDSEMNLSDPGEFKRTLSSYRRERSDVSTGCQDEKYLAKSQRKKSHFITDRIRYRYGRSSTRRRIKTF